MARITRRKLIQQVEKLEPGIAAEFKRLIARIRSEATLALIAELIQMGRVDDVATALGVNAARFTELAEKLRDAYADGGQQGASELPVLSAKIDGTRRLMKVKFSFDLRNFAAEEWLSRNAGRLITAIVEDQRRLIVEVIRAGLALGQGPRQTALDLVGRIGETGNRSGGLIGLTADQAQYVVNMRAQLLSGDAAQMAGYFDRVQRDKRFDPLVKRAIAEGKPVSAANVQKIAGRYADNLLRLRGTNIARTETITAFNAAREEAFRQAIAAGSLLPENVTGIWGATGDGRTRHTHQAMNGQKRKFGQPFVSPSGARLMYPGDTSLGAGPGEIINCRCSKIYRVDSVAEALRVN